MANTLLTKVKTDLRISHSKLDDDIQDNIDACKLDLKTCGVVYAADDDPLIIRAVKLYCKATYSDDPVKGAEWLRRYDNLKACMMMAEGYGRKADSDE